jgi:hypothetical protein
MKSFKSKNTNSNNNQTGSDNHPPFLFENKNYLILLLSLVLITLGFLMMIGGEGETSTAFNPDIFSTRRIRFAPIIIIIGYIGMIFSIFYND